MAGLERPQFGLLSDKFLEDVRQMPTKNLAVELLERLIKDEIRGRSQNNVVRNSKYGDRLAETLRKYNNRAVESGKIAEKLISMANDFIAAVKRDENLGLNPDEIAFYDAPTGRQDVLREMSDPTLKKLDFGADGTTAIRHDGGLASLKQCPGEDATAHQTAAAEVQVAARRAGRRRRIGHPPSRSAEPGVVTPVADTCPTLIRIMLLPRA